MNPNTAAYASATLAWLRSSSGGSSVAGPWQAKTRGSEPRSRQNIIGEL